MDMKDFVRQEVTGKSILKANYKRQIDYIESKLRLLNSPINESGEVGYTYFGNIPEDVLAYFRNKGIKVIDYVEDDTRRQFNGKAMYVFIPDEDTDALSDKELEEAANAEYEVITALDEKEAYYERYSKAISEVSNSIVPVVTEKKTEEELIAEAAEGIAGIICGFLEAVNAVSCENSEDIDDEGENSSEGAEVDSSDSKEVMPGDDGYDD